MVSRFDHPLRTRWLQRLLASVNSAPEAILQSSTKVLWERGLTGWSLERVSAGAECAKGLVIYHYKSKLHLLALTADGVRTSLAADRLGAISDATGAAALDRLWAHLHDEVEVELFAAWLSVVGCSSPVLREAAAMTSQDLGAVSRRLEGALDLPPGALSPVLLEGAHTGLQLRLHQGEEPARVREAFDQFWLGVFAAS